VQNSLSLPNHIETRTFISILVLLLMEPGSSKSDEEKARYDRRIQLRALNAQVAGTLLAGWSRDG
jgi:hypothetical protein